MNFTWFVRNPVKIGMFFLALILMGALSWRRLPLNLFPDLQTPRITVVTTTKGLSPEEAERRLTADFERQLASIKGVADIISYSREKHVVIHIDFHWGQDMEFAYLDVKKNIGVLETNEYVEQIDVYRFDPNAAALMTLAFTGEVDRVQAASMLENSLKPKLETVEGVAYVKANGAVRQEVVVHTNGDVMAQYQLTSDKLIQAIRNSNISSSGGVITDGNEEMTLKFVSRFKRIEDIRRCVVAVIEGHPIHLEDVGRIDVGESRDEVRVHQDGRGTVSIDIFREPDANAVLAARRVRELVERLNRRGARRGRGRGRARSGPGDRRRDPDHRGGVPAAGLRARHRRHPLQGPSPDGRLFAADLPAGRAGVDPDAGRAHRPGPPFPAGPGEPRVRPLPGALAEAAVGIVAPVRAADGDHLAGAAPDSQPVFPRVGQRAADHGVGAAAGRHLEPDRKGGRAPGDAAGETPLSRPRRGRAGPGAVAGGLRGLENLRRPQGTFRHRGPGTGAVGRRLSRPSHRRHAPAAVFPGGVARENERAARSGGEPAAAEQTAEAPREKSGAPHPGPVGDRHDRHRDRQHPGGGGQNLWAAHRAPGDRAQSARAARARHGRRGGTAARRGGQAARVVRQTALRPGRRHRAGLHGDRLDSRVGDSSADDHAFAAAGAFGGGRRLSAAGPQPEPDGLHRRGDAGGHHRFQHHPGSDRDAGVAHPGRLGGEQRHLAGRIRPAAGAAARLSAAAGAHRRCLAPLPPDPDDLADHGAGPDAHFALERGGPGGAFAGRRPGRARSGGARAFPAAALPTGPHPDRDSLDPHRRRHHQQLQAGGRPQPRPGRLPRRPGPDSRERPKSDLGPDAPGRRGRGGARPRRAQGGHSLPQTPRRPYPLSLLLPRAAAEAVPVDPGFEDAYVALLLRHDRGKF